MKRRSKGTLRTYTTPARANRTLERLRKAWPMATFTVVNNPIPGFFNYVILAVKDGKQGFVGTQPFAD